jgi:hypothetical protein
VYGWLSSYGISCVVHLHAAKVKTNIIKTRTDKEDDNAGIKLFLYFKKEYLNDRHPEVERVAHSRRLFGERQVFAACRAARVHHVKDKRAATVHHLLKFVITNTCCIIQYCYTLRLIYNEATPRNELRAIVELPSRQQRDFSI